ncbi:hypothetical protein [Pseudonocardia asaccharolytica]|uniref:SCP2 domain-containing protein n=1 Tax=Pseudonocardia asaccharolytica DSM 44247 = NBRC 16224 TaxID=1123024 RepID=A0A511D0I3_9PSEU|nr:hypothetical protein [Pseudonocardia asaccharolytica]GEL18309.1 hypothetical protein PA7_21460 [Pseudonocardia asaccharolytica DSM 44247 = NBRC 16224]
MAALDHPLLERLRDAMPNDPEMQIVGKFMRCDVLLSSGDKRYLLRFDHGRLTEIVEDPHPALAWNFALKAGPGTWERFLQDPPPPEFHDVWAAAWLGHLTLEGDIKVFMQNHFAFWRTLKLLRIQAQATSGAAA